MTGLKVGARISSASEEVIDLSKPAQETPETPEINAGQNEPEGTTPQDVTPQEDITPDTSNDEPVINNEPSSLTTDEPTRQDVSQEQPETGVNEDLVFSYLSEKLGKEIKDINDLSQPAQENLLETDPYLKGLYEWRQKTNRPIEDYVKYQKDYGKLSDLDVAREFLQHEYPNFTPDEIDAELQSFQPDDNDLDYEASAKIRNLKKYATKGRGVLQEMVAELGNPLEPKLSPEIEESVNIANQYKQMIADNQNAAKEYATNIKNTSQSIDGLKLKLADNLEIDFKVSPETKNSLPNMIDEMPHWKNQDGSWNHRAIVEDAIKIKHHDEMVRLAYEQGVNSGQEKIVKESNNITLAQPSTAAGQMTNKKGIEIEGIDKFLSGSSLKIRR